MTRAMSLAVLLVALSSSVMAQGGSDESPTWVVPFDSGTRVVREVAEALSGDGRSILECYPWGSRAFLGLLSLLPEAWRIAGIEWGMRLSLGHPPSKAADVRIDDLAAWCVGQYESEALDDRAFDAIVVGSPNGAVAHLAALLGAPFLTTSFGIAFRHPTIDADEVAATRRTAGAAANAIVGANPEAAFEIVCHVDPLHDRSIVRFADFVRIKLHDLPDAYRRFITERLAPGGRLILVDCAYEWPQYRLADRITLQVGGLGDVPPEEYLARWPIDAAIEVRRESEWGCPETFAEAVRTFATAEGVDAIALSFDRPWDVSLLAYDAYLACDGVRSEELLIDCFNHQNPRTHVETGIPALWLPFHTTDGLRAVGAFLDGRSFDTIRFTLLPSFVDSPDASRLDSWSTLLGRHGSVEPLGVRADRYPADVLAPFRFVDAMSDLREAEALSTPLRLDLDAFARLVDANDGRQTDSAATR